MAYGTQHLQALLLLVGLTGTVTGIAGGTATISYTVSNGCTATATTIVTVNTSTITFTTTPPAQLCRSVSATYTTQPGNQSNYIWTVSGTSGTDYNITAGGTGSSNNSVTLTWLTASTKTVTVNYTGANGCGGIKRSN